MRVALLLLFLVILIFVVILNLQFKRDGFQNSHTDFVTRQHKQYGNVGISLLTAKNDGALGTSANTYLNTFDEPGNYPLKDTSDGLWTIIDKCEAIKTVDCNAFDDPEFNLNCGICLEIGKNSEKAPSTGGIVLLDKHKRLQRVGTNSNFTPAYVPTIGFCPAGKLASNKKECLRLQKEIQCQKNSNFDIPGCSLCYTTGEYAIVDPIDTPGIISEHGTIYISGVGILNFQEDGFDPVVGINLSSSPYSIPVRSSGTSRIKLSVSPPLNSNINNPTIPYVQGYITGITLGGKFSSDLSKLVMTDEISGRKPRSMGAIPMNSTNVIKMAPAFGQTRMVLSVIVPFSFVDVTTRQASICKNGPFVTDLTGANFLESDPCFKRGSGPGKYSLECLQNVWISNGCTQSGKGYPSNNSTAAELMTSPDGSSRTINDIANYIYVNAIITSTGIDDTGNKKTIQDWSAASVFCTGKEINSPCEGPEKDTGPLSPECIIYLWNNQGSSKLWNGNNNPIGPTYDYANAYSLFRNGMVLRGCQASGYMSPIDTHGTHKKPVIEYWQTQGGVNNVKTMMRNLHAAANAQAASDDTRAPYFKNCYGNIDYAARPPPIPPPMPAET
jgi:hypothetical protein